MRSKRMFIAALATSVGLLASACSSDSKSGSATTAASTASSAAADTTAATTAASTATSDSVAGTDTTGSSTDSTAGSTASSAAGSDLQLDAAVKIVALASDPGGTDQNAIPDFNDGARYAIDEINAAGGIGGFPVEFKAIETLPTGDTVLNSLNLGLEEKPTAFLGPVSSTGLLAISAKVDEAGIPMIHITTEPKAVTDGEAGSKWIFGNRPGNAGAATVAARYAIEELGAKKIGLMHVNTSFGTSGADAQKAAIAAAGATVSADQSFEFNATDLTNAALAMDGSDAILDWGTPATVGLSVNTLAQQGLASIPHIGPGSIAFGFFSAIVGDASVLEGVLGVIDCNPEGDDRPQAKAFVEGFTAKYGYAPSYASAEQYDSVYMIKHAIEAGGNADPETIRAGLEALKGFEGVCSKNYTNINGVLNHTSVVAKFVDGKLVTQKEYSVDS